MINSQPIYRVLNQNIRKIFIEVSIVDSKGISLGVLKGYTLDGMVTLSSDNSYRRSGHLVMVLTSAWDVKKLFWFNTKARLRIGMKDFLTDEIFWFSLGEFAVKNMSISREMSGNTVELQLLDNMAFLDGSLGGIITNEIRLEAKNNIPIHEAVKTILSSVGITKTSVEPIMVNNEVKNIPYNLEFPEGTVISEILKSLINLYQGYEGFFDVDGIFVLRRIRDRKNDISLYKFGKDGSKLSMGNIQNFDFGKVKNSIVINGYKDNYGVQVTYRCRNRYSRNDMVSLSLISDAIKGDICYVVFENKSYIYNGTTWDLLNFNVTPVFNIENIGLKPLVIEDGNVFNLEQAKTMAEFYIFTNSNLGEEVNITTVPVYGLDVNNKITTDELGDCLVRSLNVPLNISETMTVMATKIY